MNATIPAMCTFALVAAIMAGASGAGEPAEAWQPPAFKERAADRRGMVQHIRRAYRLNDKAVLDALQAVPRHEFTPRRHRSSAYRDRPLPIGHGQTISQPYIVGEMTRRLDLESADKVLEVGTGSGYQAAVLTHFTRHVYSVEIIPELARSAARRLDRLGYDVVKTRTGDGYYGWEEHAPFDAIVVTAAAGQIPPPLLEQLANGGRMVIPVGGRFAVQRLMLVTKDEEGKVRSRSLMAVRFVPLTRHREREEE